MGKRLTDKQKKKIIREYVETENYSEVARRNKIAVNTVKNIVKHDNKVFEKCKHKKEENIKSVLAHMDAKKKDVNELIDRFLEAMKDEEKIENASLRELATAMGIIIDKYTANETTIDNNEDKIININLIPATRQDIEE